MAHAADRGHDERGFNLVEVAFVLAILATIVTVTVPTYDHLLRRTHAAEADATVHAIAQAELRHFRDRGGFLACPAAGDIPTSPVPFPADTSCWRALGIAPEGLVRYRYGVELTDDSYVVTAEGDLDGDGVPSRFVLTGHDLALTVTDETE